MTEKTYKVTCAATGKSCSVRPEVWEQRIKKFGTDSDTLQKNYLCREALAFIKQEGSPLERLAELQKNNSIPQKYIDLNIWNKYLAKDEDVLDVIQNTETLDNIKEEIETIEI